MGSLGQRDDDEARPRIKHRGKAVTFSQDSLKEFVTGFRKRRQQRQAAGAAQLAKKERFLRNQGRKERRDALNAEIEQKLRKRQRQKDDDDVADDGWSSQAAKKQRADGEEGVEEEAQVEGLDAAGAAEDGREDGHDADAAPLPVPLPPRPSTAWKYEDDVALVTVHTHSLDADDPQPPSDHEGAEEGRGEAGAASTPGTATGWRGQQPLGFTGGGRPGAPGSSKKALGKKKLKKKDKRGPRRLMKGKKEKALGSAKKGKGRR